MKVGQLTRAPWRSSGGLTLLELMLALAVAAVLAVIAQMGYSSIVEKGRVAHAKADIAEFDVLIERYRTGHREYPATIDDFNYDGRLDPWGNPYQYTLLAGINGHGSARKDHKLNPLNSDYDLFSAGRDGVFKTQITQKDSLDDVIRARTGAYIGLAADY
ncbi:prepilin-type N-terminal cleavage/methylation domain-containing protein [Lysobacter sp. HA35]